MTHAAPSAEAVAAAAAVLREAEALVIAAGAGLGVDSGLPDFRGPEGFWQAYPPYRALGLRFEELAQPRWFTQDPRLAWGFYGHRLGLYRRTAPHDGFRVLRALAERMPAGAFVFTSNVDGQFQRAGFDPTRIVERHGVLDFVQCTRDCGVGILAADPFEVQVDPETLRAVPPLPACPACGALLRPNVLMFNDAGWDDTRTAAQVDRLEVWLGGVAGKRLVVVECGAGRGVPTVRHFSESMTRMLGARLVRINLREPEVPAGHLGLAAGARDTLRALETAL